MMTAFTGWLLLSQIVFWTGLALAFMLFFRFGKVKDWFNRKAGAEIVSTVRFRDVRTLCITVVLEWVMGMVGVLVAMPSYSEKQLTDSQFLLLCSLFPLVGLAYPVYRLVRRIRHLKSCNDRKAARWRLYYDCLLNYAALSGGWMVAVIMSFVAVLLSLTKWKSLVPGRLRDMAGVDVVPPSITYYLVGCALGVVGIVSQFFGREKEDFIFGMIFVSLFAFLAYIVFRVRRAAPQDRKRLKWMYAYMLFTTYAVFTLTWMLIVGVLVLLVLYLIFTLVFSGYGGSGKGSRTHAVSCNQLTDDLIRGQDICKLTNTRCKMRDTGVCPYQ